MKKLKKKISVSIEKTEQGFSAFADELNVYTTAENVQSLRFNLVEALNLHYEDKGYVVSSENLQLRIDLQQFFQFYRVLNAKFLAERIGMNPTLLSQYVRGNKRPSSRQSIRIMEGIQEIGKELSGLRFS